MANGLFACSTVLELACSSRETRISGPAATTVGIRLCGIGGQNLAHYDHLRSNVIVHI
jgi:hypothetical protein